MPAYVRVLDPVTGHKVSVPATAVTDDVEVLDGEDAVDVYGNALPPEYAATAADSEPEEVEIPDGTPSDRWTVPQLTAYAVREGIDLPDPPRKADIITAIAKAEEARQ